MNSKTAASKGLYAAVVVVGVLFVITAFAYMILMARGMDRRATRYAASDHRLLAFLEQHGTTLIVVELVILAVVTIGALGIDGRPPRRAASEEEPRATPPQDEHRQ